MYESGRVSMNNRRERKTTQYELQLGTSVLGKVGSTVEESIYRLLLNIVVLWRYTNMTVQEIEIVCKQNYCWFPTRD